MRLTGEHMNCKYFPINKDGCRAVLLADVIGLCFPGQTVKIVPGIRKGGDKKCWS